MYYFVSDSGYPLRHISSGKLVSRDGFLHNRRNLDTFVLLVGCQGVLYITQDDRTFELHPNQFIILFPGHVHFGHCASEGELSYYWCHFQLTHDRYEILPDTALTSLFFEETAQSSVYLLPEHGDISSGERTSLVFRQLLDLASKSCYSPDLPNYALSLLALEISQEAIDYIAGKGSGMDVNAASKTSHSIAEITAWIRLNYDQNLSVQKIAEIFDYNPDYLSAAFKRHTGLPLIQYINHIKIGVAKQLLLESSAPVREIAHCAGFGDEKHFMKLFKQLEDVTPTQFRSAFYRQKLNRQ